MDGRLINGPRLRDLRLQADLSTGDLARRVDIVEGHLRNIEGKGDQPSGRLAYRLARELSKALDREVSIDDFSHETSQEDAA